MARPILQTRLAHAPWMSAQTARMPGTTPVAADAWLTVDEAYAAQLAERARLIVERPDAVMAHLPGSEPALGEVLERVLDALDAREDFALEARAVIRPDGRAVTLDARRPLATLGHLVQEDFCLLEKPGGAEAHVLTAAILCFPANWTLAEKLGRPLGAIHAPVPQYVPRMAARVQRLFDALRPVEEGGRILMRMNAIGHCVPDLFQPRRENDPPGQGQGQAQGRGQSAGGYLRIERQCLRKLPRSGAVVFSIHTTVLAQAALSPRQAADFAAYCRNHGAG